MVRSLGVPCDPIRAPSPKGLAYLERWRRAWALERAKVVGGVCRQQTFVKTDLENTREEKGNRGSHVGSFVSIWALWAPRKLPILLRLVLLRTPRNI